MNKLLRNATLILATAALLLQWCKWSIAHAIGDKAVTPTEIKLLPNWNQYLITLENWQSQIIDVSDLVEWLVTWDRVMVDMNWEVIPWKTQWGYELWDLEQFSRTAYSIPVDEKVDIAWPEE